MAEVLATASAIAGLVSLTSKILSEGYSYIASIRRAPKELRQLLSETAALDTILGQLQSLSEDDGWSSSRSALKDLVQGGIIDECTELLHSVQMSIVKCKQIKGQEIRNVGKMLVWPFKEKETKDALARLSRVRGHLTTALSVDTMVVLRDVQKTGQEMSIGLTELRGWTEKRDEAEHRRALLKWLDPNAINVDDNLREGLKLHHPGTGEWLFNSVPFREWSEGESSLLWIYGIPGSGKTVLASSAIETFLTQSAGSQNALVYFFCDHRDSSKRKFESFLLVAVLQLLRQRQEGFEAVEMFAKDRTNSQTPLRTKESLNLFATLATKFSRITIVVDALDECEELEQFIEGLATILDTGGTTVIILVTSRNDFALEQLLSPLTTCRLSLEKNIGSDIARYVTDEVDSRISSRKLKIRNPQLKDDIVSALIGSANGMFMLVRLQLDIISRLTNDKAIRGALWELPRSLDDSYIRLLQDVKSKNADNIEIVRRLLTWLVASRTPLTLNQLAEAIAIDPNDSFRDPDKMITDPGDLLAMLGSLVTVDYSYNPKDPIVSLAHFTLDAFLQSDAIQIDSSVSIFYVSPNSSWTLAVDCIHYMSLDDFKEACRSPASLQARKATYTLLDYAANNWFLHLSSYGPGRGPGISGISPILRWFTEPNYPGQQFISWQQVFHNKVAEFVENDPLYYAIDLRLGSLIGTMFKNRADSGTIVERYTTLHVAIIYGDEQIVERLLLDVPDLETTGPRNLTALHLAAEYGKPNIIRLLLAAGASPHAKSDSGTTPFYRAARSGSVEALDLLYQAGSDINARTWDGWTAIFEAIENSHPAAVERMVQMGADLDAQLNYGPSVLQFARQHGRQDIIELIEKAISAR